MWRNCQSYRLNTFICLPKALRTAETPKTRSSAVMCIVILKSSLMYRGPVCQHLPALYVLTGSRFYLTCFCRNSKFPGPVLSPELEFLNNKNNNNMSHIG